MIYINDLANVSDKIFSILFADDSNLFMSGKNPNQLISTMNTEMVKVIKWLSINKLSLNLTKTHYIVSKQPKRKLVIDTELIINSIKIDSVTKTKFLGVIIDEKLTFREHTQYLKGKVSRGLGIMYKAKRYLNKETYMTLYYSYIYPYFHYCIAVWGNTCDSYIDPLLKLQKRAIRIICGKDRYAHTYNLFKDTKVLGIRQIFTYSIQIFVYKFNNNLLPSIFWGFFEYNYNIHNHNTRQIKLLHAPIAQSEQRKRTIRFAGVHANNHFERYIPHTISLLTYKQHLKSHILANNVHILG